jgi:multiple sugar transport system permease protein
VADRLAAGPKPTPHAVGRPQGTRRGARRFPERWALMSPGVLAMVMVLLVPLAYAGYLSLFHYNLTDPLNRSFAGTANYRTFLGDARFSAAITTTLVLAFGATALEFLLGFALALALAKPGLRGRDAYLAVLVVPMLMPYVAGGLIWLLMLHPTLGIVNYLITTILGTDPPSWLSTPGMARLTIILVDAWHNTSWMVLILLAGLLSLPEEPYGAASVDGAGALARFRYITLPLLRPTILTALVIKLIGALLSFDLIYVLTQGGPGESTQTLSFYIWRLAFQDLDIGAAAAASYGFFVVIALLVLVLMRLLPDPVRASSGRRLRRAG